MLTKYLKKIVIGVAALTMLSSCQEQIDEGARFTFVGNTVASYLQSLPECSHFVEILTRGECISLLKAYGEYTCFAPSNESLMLYLAEEDSVKSISELSEARCAEIAKNHIVPGIHLNGDLLGQQSLPEFNMNKRRLTYGLEKDGTPIINKQAKVKWETEVENGVVHVTEGVISPSKKKVPELMGESGLFSIFTDALVKTGYAEVLNVYQDLTYTDGKKIVQGIRTTQMAPYPSARNYGFTVFLESDEVLAKEGITDSTLLEKKCMEWYPDGTIAWTLNKETNDWDTVHVNHLAAYDDPRNPVNQFVGYHILDRKVDYDNLVCHGLKINAKTFSYDYEKNFPQYADHTEYFTTINNRILKVTKPLDPDVHSSSEIGKIFLNYAPNGKGQNVQVYSLDDLEGKEDYQGYNPAAINGELNVIDRVLRYREDVMEKHVLRCIMRIDVASICPELTNNDIRWKSPSEEDNRDGDVFIPEKYCDRIKFISNETRLFYLPPHTEPGWYNYQGDEMMALGAFDFAYRLPPLPAGTYEIRLGYTASQYRHVVQVYLDDEVTGLPIDLRLTGENAKINWKHDKDQLNNNEEEIAANDKDMKNRGYLKGPKSFYDDNMKEARYNKACLRAVIATKYLTTGSHWLRFKNVNDADDGSAQFMHDYFEIVPTDYLKDESISVKEKRN